MTQASRWYQARNAINLLLILSSCSTDRAVHRPSGRLPASENASNADILPEISKNAVRTQLLLAKALRKQFRKMSPADIQEQTRKITRYLSFLGLTDRDFPGNVVSSDTETVDAAPVVTQPVPVSDPEDSEGEDDGDKTPSNQKAIQRLLAASTQFLNCPDFTDWDCLELDPKLPSTAAFRQPLKPGLGLPVPAGRSLDMETFFTEGWDGSPISGVATRLGERIARDAQRSLSLRCTGSTMSKGA